MIINNVCNIDTVKCGSTYNYIVSLECVNNDVDNEITVDDTMGAIYIPISATITYIDINVISVES